MNDPHKSQHNKYLDTYMSHRSKKILCAERETDARRKNGEIFPIELSVSEMEIDGKIYFAGSIRDISFRKRSEKQLEESTQFLDSIIDNLPIALQIFDNEGYSLRMNDSQAKLIGVQNKYIGIGLFNVLTDPFSISSKSYVRFQQAYQGKTLLNNEFEADFGIPENVWETTQNKKYLSETIFPIFDSDKKVSAVVALTTDISERKQTEMALRQSEEMLRIMFEYSFIGIAVGNAEGNLISFNHAFCEMLNYAPSELLNINFSTFTHPNDIKYESEIINRIILKEIDTYTIEKRYVKKHGDIIWVRLNVSCVRNAEGSIKNFIGNVENITERRIAEEHLFEAKQKAEEANRLKSDFLANMSHEIRTPMNAILGFSEIIKEKLDKQPELAGFVDGIMTSGKNLLNLINDILDLSKIEAGRFEIQKEAVNFRNIVNDINQIFLMKTSKKGIGFRVEIEKWLPENLVLDETRLRQVLFNLVGNAVKFTEKGEIVIYITGKQSDKPLELNYLLIEIKDTGIGIPAEQQTLIFEPFQQREGQSTRKYGGTGLGLAITRRLVEMMGGKISLESTPNVGSTFRVQLFDVQTPLVSVLKTESVDYKIPKVQFLNPTILLVEDMISNRLVVRCYLEQYNIKVVEAENGKQALELAEQYKPDLILMDLHMPVMDGFECTKHLKSNQYTKHTPVIALTALAMKEQSVEIIKICDDYLKKPISKADLIKMLIKFLPFQHVYDRQDIYNQATATNVDDKKTHQRVLKIDFESLPKELCSILKIEISPLISKLKIEMELETVEMVSNRLIELSQQFKISSIELIANELNLAAQTFDFEKVFSIQKQLEPLFEKINEIFVLDRI